ncbi:MAG: Fe-S-binding domain-containing protein, partial [Chromatiaceae bacterium]|nr:Fe-S-binding domain-containing protein [Chromatiaceae bacterium]
MNSVPVLSILLLFPVVGALLVGLLPGRRVALIRWTAILVALLTLVLAWGLLGWFDARAGGVQWFE